MPAKGWRRRVGVGTPAGKTKLEDLKFDSPAFDRSLSYHVPAELLDVVAPPTPDVEPIPRWTPDPHVELINPWRYWELVKGSETVEKRILRRWSG